MTDRSNLLQGTLDLLVLKALAPGELHGLGISRRIEQITQGTFHVKPGSLFPALHRLERKGWIVSKWETASERNREFKYYRLTEKGKKQLLVEESQWKQMTEAVARVMWPSAEES